MFGGEARPLRGQGAICGIARASCAASVPPTVGCVGPRAVGRRKSPPPSGGGRRRAVTIRPAAEATM
eukprot:13196558-Alexandrium_andersonii.AAC.1